MVHKESFTYTDDNKIRYDESVGVIPVGVIKNGTSFRCRLKKIDTVKPIDNILDEVSTLVNYNDGWVSCEISDVDIYNRLLVEIYDIDKKYCINKILLDNYPHFFRYYPINNRFNKKYFNFPDSRKKFKSNYRSGSGDDCWRRKEG